MQNERKPNQNLLLANLPPDELVHLIPLLQPMALARGTVVYRIGDPVDFIYFPSGELVAEAATLDDIQGLEVLSIGREGAIGAGALSGLAASAHDVEVQTSGAVWAIGAAELKRALQYCPVLQDRLIRYLSDWLMQISQSAAHEVSHRITKLCTGKPAESSERSGGREPLFSHEAGTMSLGGRRAGITSLVATRRRGLSVVRAIRPRSSIGD